jgi:hypothetical protein
VQANGASLLGLVGVEALSLIDLSAQSLSAVDPNNNLQTVQVRYAPLLGLLPAYTLTGSAALANELGLQLSINNNAGVLGLVAPSSTVTGSRTAPARHVKSHSKPCGMVASTGAVGTPAAASRSSTSWGDALRRPRRRWRRTTSR